MTSLIQHALRRSVRSVHYVHAVAVSEASGTVAAVYAQVERDFGILAPPMALHSPSPDLLASAWMMLRETLLVPGTAGRAAKEAVATSVSERNTCPYCVEVHSAAMRATVREADEPPVAEGNPAESTGVAVTFHYLNRMVNVFLGQSPLPDGIPDGARRFVRPLLGRTAKPKRPIVAGESLRFLDEAELPAALGWAGQDPVIAGAFARTHAAFEAAADRSVPRPVRELVVGELAAWHGEPKGPSRAWATEAAANLPEEHRPAAVLALLTAIASYQVDPAVVEGFRARNPSDTALVELTGWASFQAAIRAEREEDRD